MQQLPGGCYEFTCNASNLGVLKISVQTQDSQLGPRALAHQMQSFQLSALDNGRNSSAQNRTRLIGVLKYCNGSDEAFSPLVFFFPHDNFSYPLLAAVARAQPAPRDSIAVAVRTLTSANKNRSYRIILYKADCHTDTKKTRYMV